MHKIASIFIDENKAYLEKNNFMTYIPFHKNDAINFRTLEGNPSLCHRQHKKARCVFFFHLQKQNGNTGIKMQKEGYHRYPKNPSNKQAD